jgi:3-carboxy-cis,cis-muconate cycloisomerase
MPDPSGTPLRLFESLATTESLAGAFSDASLLGSMLRFEAALARVQARLGLIPDFAAEAITHAAVPDAFDPVSIARAARRSGTITIPLVDGLVARVKANAPEAAAFVHRGATSQDVSDTALILCLVQASNILAADHDRLTGALRRMSDEHAGTIMLGRTLLQPALPTTFGLKVAGWYGAVSRSGTMMAAAFETACVLQFGGACGTLAALGSHGPAVSAALARELDLPEPDAPWHVHRDRLAGVVAACGIYTGTLGKIARDISLLMQHEVGEAAEPGGGSSTMPHKQNPAACAAALAAANRVPGMVAGFLAGMPQEHERGIGNWHAEAATVSAVVQATGSALAAMAQAIEQLRVDSDRMRANIDATDGLIFAERAMMLLVPALGRDAADRAIRTAMTAARASGANFVHTLLTDGIVQAALRSGERATLADSESYLGAAEHFRRRLLGVPPE